MPGLGLLGLGVVIGMFWGWVISNVLRSAYGGKRAAESAMSDIRKEMKELEKENARLQLIGGIFEYIVLARRQKEYREWKETGDLNIEE